MPELKLILGPAGSGKTHCVTGKVAQCAARGALPGLQQPPLLVIVPEQQAAAVEAQILRRLSAEHGQNATARVRVMSLTRLAAWLMQQAGAVQEQPGDLGRRLLAWSLTPDSPRREAQAAVYAELLAELAQYGVSGAQLRERAAGASQPLAQKLTDLAQLLECYQAACRERGFSFAPVAARIPELLVETNWPYLEQTLVWVDGFAGFTPVEERALAALLGRCTRVTATLLIAPDAVAGDEQHLLAREYRPTRELYQRWLELAAGARASVVPAVRLDQLPRWPAGSPLAGLARDGLYAAQQAPSPPAQAGAGLEHLPDLRAVACADERLEVVTAARTIRTLVLPPELGGRGWRYRDVSVIARRLEPYAALVPLVFGEYGIPYFLDARRSVAHHPAAEYLRCGVRLALGQAAAEDVYTLLKTDLLPGGTDWRARVDELELYARESALRPGDWLRQAPWHWHRELLRHEERGAAPAGHEAAIAQRLAQYDAWRRELLAPVLQLEQELQALPAPGQLREVLASIWQRFITDGVAQALETWAAAAEALPVPRSDLAALHRGVLGELMQLFDELVRIAGGMQLEPAELCAWLEFGLGGLDLGYSPPTLDAVLVTDIERGRQQGLRGALLLGLAEDLWPPAAEQTPLLSDAERRELNRPDKLVAGGAEERSGRELYLALVAATRASELLHLSRPAGDMDGRKRQPSPYYAQLGRRLDLSERWEAQEEAAGMPQTPGELYCQAALAAQHAPLAQAAQALRATAPVYAAALDWGRSQARARGAIAALSPEELRAALGAADGRLVLHGSVSRLEAFAACPFKYFAHYLLRIDEPPERELTLPGLGGFYHRVLERTISTLNAQGCDWARITPGEFLAAGLAVLDAVAPQLLEETGAQRADYVLERARMLLAHKLPAELATLQDKRRAPRLTELRFGQAGDPLPPVSLDVAAGELRLSGYIDRLDVAAGGLATVIDYKLSSRKVDWREFLAGKQLQLITYLLAVDGQPLGAGPEAEVLRAAQAGYSPVEPGWTKGETGFVIHSVPPELKQSAKQEQLGGLLGAALAQARRILGELGERMLSGEIGAQPLADPAGRWTACSECSYRSLCRFDPLAGGRYRELRPESSAVLRDRIAQGESFAGSAQAGPAPEVRQ